MTVMTSLKVRVEEMWVRVKPWQTSPSPGGISTERMGTGGRKGDSPIEAVTAQVAHGEEAGNGVALADLSGAGFELVTSD